MPKFAGQILGQIGVLHEAESFRAELKVVGSGQRYRLEPLLQQGEGGPAKQDDDHHGGDLHDPQGLFAGFLNPLGVLPPEVHGDCDGEHHRRPIDVYVGRAMEQVVHGARDPAVGVGGGKGVIDQSCDVLSGGNARDRPGEDVIEHQGGDTDLGQACRPGPP